MTIEEIRQDENRNLEFKEVLPTNAGKYLKTLVAFANCSGGKLIVGVEDETLEVKGVVESEVHSVIDKLASVISTSIEPQIIPNIYKDTIAGKAIVVCEIYFGAHTPYYIKSLGKQEGCFIRTAGQTRLADAATLKELELRGEDQSYDALIYRNKEISVDEIEKTCKKLTDFARENATLNVGREEVRPLTIRNLISWEVVKQVGEKYYATNAYMMLQDDNPFDFVKVQCAVFKGTTRSLFIDKKDMTGPIYEQVDSAYKFVLQHINLSADVEGIYRVEEYELPPKGIREIITNACIHRILNVNSCVQVAVYDDRVEITSPGHLYGNLTLKMALSGQSLIRNKALAKVFNYLQLIESWGTGISKTMDMCRQMNIREPEFVDLGNAIRVNFYRPSYNAKKSVGVSDGVNVGVNDGVNSLSITQSKVLEILKENPALNLDEISHLCGVSQRTIERAIAKLKKLGYIERVGSDKTGYYKILK